MSSIPCDIVLLPEKALADKAISASNQLQELGSLFLLEDGKCFPHMSLYMFQLDTDDIPKVEKELKRIAAGSVVVKVGATRYCLGEGFGIGYIDPEYAVTPELRKLQDDVVRAINPIRAGMRQKDIAKMQDAEGIKLDNFKKYGYPAIGELFRPHMTLARLDAHKPEALDVLPDVSEFNGTFDRIGLFEMGDNGTCVKKLLEIPLIPYTIELTNS